MKTGLLSDGRLLLHDTGKSHPECADRIITTLNHLEKQAWFSQLVRISATSCDEAWIHEVHEIEFIKRAQKTCQQGLSFLDSQDVKVNRESFDTAVLAAGGILRLVDIVMSKKVINGFAITRPPGHHSEKDMALGFCILNNVAIAARYLQKQHGVGKILILDWDVHHGNGTQHIFESDSSIFYISLHQFPHYPGTGSISETGIGKGRGTTMNCPMPPGSGNKDYQNVFKDKILPEVANFKPEVILISAGFDAHKDDPLGSINLTTSFYSWMTQRVLEFANQYADDRIISVLEGGYNLNALANSIKEHLSVLSGIRTESQID